MINRYPALKQTIRTKLVILLMAIAILSATLTTFVFSAYEFKTADNADTLRLQTIADILAPNLTASILFDDIDTANELISPLKEQPSIIDVTVFDVDGNIFVKKTSDLTGLASLQKLKKISTPLIMENQYYGELVIEADNSMLVQHVQVFIYVLISIVIVTLITSFIFSLIMSNKFTKPIVELAQIANKVTKSNDYSLRASNSQNDEIGDLTQCFNSMLATIEQRDQTLELQVFNRTKQLKEANSKLKYQAYTDSLTGFPNRRYLLELMHTLMNTPGKEEPFTLLFFDLDGFKEVNDTLGHDAGDELIVAVINRISNSIKNNDIVARLGGDEFTVLVKGVTDQKNIATIARNIQHNLAKPFQISDEKISITSSIGISRYPGSGVTVESIMKKADLAMYDAKGSGRNCFRFFENPMLEKLQAKRQMAHDLRIAIERNEFELHFQPIINLSTGIIDKAEALIRWNHPTRGYISPEAFIPFAEENGLIDQVGSWVSEQAITAVLKVRQRLCDSFTITINASPVQFRKDSQWFNFFIDKLEQSGLGRHAIAVEITENTLMGSDKPILDKLIKLRAKGVEIAIDDFGVGYSSLSYLQKLNVDIIKIDRSFVQQLNQNLSSNTLCKTIVNMADNLNMKVVAEGIEAGFQSNLLEEFGCLYGQGYYFSKPITIDQLEELLTNNPQTHVSFNI